MPAPPRTTTSPGRNGPPRDPDERAARRRTIYLGAGIACFVAIAIFWVLILSGWFKTVSPDRLSDRAWVTKADKLCDAAQTAIDDLPNAKSAATAKARSRLLDRGSDQVETLVRRLSDTHLATSTQQRIVDEWIKDWRVYLHDRRSYAQELLSNPKARATFTEVHGQNVTDEIDNFAKVNEMYDCTTPLDM